MGEQGATGAESAAELAVLDLITAVTPASALATPGEKNAWFTRREETLLRMRSGGKAVGSAALRAFHRHSKDLLEIRIGLLDVAAHATPEETTPLLVELVETYGPDLGLRAAASRFLAVTDPERARVLIEGVLMGTTPRRTWPPLEQLFAAWLKAVETLGLDPVPVAARVATDFEMEPAARHAALRALGRFPSPVGQSALDAVMTESIGNDYARRIAAQSLRATMPVAELCPRLRQALEREADPRFQVFLADMIEVDCP